MAIIKKRSLVILICLFIQVLVIQIPFEVKVIEQSDLDDKEVSAFIDLPFFKGKLRKHELIIKTTIGTPPQQFSHKVDTGSLKTWVFDKVNCRDKCNPSSNKFDFRLSSSFQTNRRRDGVSYLSGYAEGVNAFDFIGFQGFKSVSLMYVLALEGEIDSDDGIIGFGYKSSENALYDIIYQMIKARIVDLPIFSFSFDKTENGRFYLGEYPQGISLNNTRKCTIPSDSLKWECHFTKISMRGFNDIPVSNNEKIIFDTGNSITLFNKKIWELTINSLFNKFIKQQICKVETIQYNISGLICNERIENEQFPPIEVILGNTSIIIFDHFTFIGSNQYRFTILRNDNEKSNECILGLPLLKKYHIIFNKEGKIEWAPNENFINSDYTLKKEEGIVLSRDIHGFIKNEVLDQIYEKAKITATERDLGFIKNHIDALKFNKQTTYITENTKIFNFKIEKELLNELKYSGINI